MINSTVFLRLIIQFTLIILIIDSEKTWGIVLYKRSDYSQPQPPIFNDGGSRFAQNN
jgi:hypothetical protein